MITYEFDPNTLAKVERKLGSLKSEAPKALKNAINQTAKAARKDLARMELKDSKVSPATARTGSKRPSITKAKVLASGSLKGLEKGGIKAFVTKFGSGHASVAQRRGSSRLPLKVLFSNSIPKMIGNEKRVYGIVEPTIQQNLQANIDKQVRKILEA